MNHKLLGSISVWLAMVVWPSAAIAQEPGRIAGRLLDAETGEPLIGANIIIVGTTMGASSAIDGSFLIPKVAPGVYAVVVSYISYQETRISGVQVLPGQTAHVDAAIKPESIVGEEVVVEARMIQNNEATLLKNRQMAVAFSDAISSEAISKSGSGDAAAAMTRVTGASVVGGRYVYIRGLGDRYSNTQLNGVELPSADPDKKAVHLDLFPSGLLDNITTIKTFTPDKPGTFSGGIVDVNTKTYPDKFTVRLSSSASVNSQSTFNGGFLKYSGGSTDWLGMDDGSRSIPGPLKDPEVSIPSPQAARNDQEKAYRLDAFSRSFRNSMTPHTGSAPLNQNFSLTVGNQTELMGRPLGFSGTFSYGRNFSYYDNGRVGKWQLNGSVDESDALENRQWLTDTRGMDEVLWGGLLMLSFKPHPHHEVTANYYYSQSGQSVARYLNGAWHDELGNDDAVYETRSLLYSERNLRSFQFHGDHYLKTVLNSTLNWNLAFSGTNQNDPDLRFFSDDYFYDAENDRTVYNISSNLYERPSRYFRDLEETNLNLQLDWSVPFRTSNGRSGKIKLGTAVLSGDRTFRERRFEYQWSALGAYTGDPEVFFGESLGIVDSTNNRYLFGSYIKDVSKRTNNYDASQDVAAGYAMIEWPLTRRLRLIGGARLEQAALEVVSQDTAQAKGLLDNMDLLPSVNLVYQVLDNMNVRAAYGRTLARPTFRELAPFGSFEFIGDYQFVGNPNLQRTVIDNWDLRWEWFMNPGEILAVSGFYKHFRNPIERTYDIGNRYYGVQNVGRGEVIGAELEFRRRLGVVASFLENFQVGANVTLVRSAVDIPDSEYVNNILPFDPNAEDTRPLSGQSPYLINLDVSYDHPKSKTSIGLSYNRFGRRLSEVTTGALPDVFEQPRSEVGVTVTQPLWRRFELKAAVKNLLNDKVRKVIRFKGEDYIFHEYSTGRTFSLGLSYRI